MLARSTVQAPDEGDAPDDAIDQDAAEVIAGLDELDAVRLDGTPGPRAELAVMVTGPGDDERGATRPSSGCWTLSTRRAAGPS